jgi:triosephosphate isomerase
VPEGVPVDKYKTTFIYEKNGIKKEFDLTDYPANDSTWKFVDQKSVLIKRGYKPPIHDFIITSLSGEDITQQILSFQGYTVLMISKNLADAGNISLSDGFRFGHYCIANGINYYILSSSATEKMKRYENGLTFCTADETTLKTMVRANPGYILLKDGTIIGKWSSANVPGQDWFGKLIKH